MGKQGDAVDVYMTAYEQKFGDMFPRSELSLADDEALVEAIRRCLDAGQPAKIVFGLKYSDKSTNYQVKFVYNVACMLYNYLQLVK